MHFKKHTLALLMALACTPFGASAGTLAANDQTNTISGLDASQMLSKDNGNTWLAYSTENQNNFPGNVVVIVAVKDEMAIKSQAYDPSQSYPTPGTVVRYNGYYWSSQWWVNPGEMPGSNSVWLKGAKVNINTLATFTFTPYTGQAAVDFQNEQKGKVAAQRKVYGYFPEWGVYDAHQNFTPDKIDYTGITHLNYGFAVVKQGVVVTHDTEKGPGLMRELDQRTELAGVTNILSVGGWNNSEEGQFEAATATDAGIETLANSIVSYMMTWGFDGVDIDWEYPDTDAEKTQFTKLIKSLRTKLDAEGVKEDRYYQLSAAVTANHNKIQYINPAETVPLLDSVNVMSYDFHGAFDPITGHNSPLFANSKDADLEFNSASAMAAYSTTWKVPKSKLMMGLAWYGRGWGNVEPTEIVKGLPGLFAPGTATVHGQWDDNGQYTGTNPWYYLKGLVNNGQYTRYWDPESRVPYLYNSATKEFLTYDDPQSIREKVDYINKEGYGGAIVWDLSGDTPDHELGNIVKKIITTPARDPDLKGLFVTLFDNQQRVVINLDATKLSPGNAYRVEVDGQYLFSTEGSSAYYSYRYNYGKEVSLRTGNAAYILRPGAKITVKRTKPNPAVIGELIVTEDMLKGNNPVINDGDVKSLKVISEDNVPNVLVEFAKDKLKSADGSSYIVKVIDDDVKKGNYIFSCDNGSCYYSSVSDKGDTMVVKSPEWDISVGETVVVERTSPNPATIAKIVVTADMLK
jgi:chitinase